MTLASFHALLHCMLQLYIQHTNSLLLFNRFTAREGAHFQYLPQDKQQPYATKKTTQTMKTWNMNTWITTERKKNVCAKCCSYLQYFFFCTNYLTQNGYNYCAMDTIDFSFSIFNHKSCRCHQNYNVSVFLSSCCNFHHLYLSVARFRLTCTVSALIVCFFILFLSLSVSLMHSCFFPLFGGSKLIIISVHS